MITLFSALKEETAGLKKRMAVLKQSSYQGFRFYEGKCGRRDSLLVLTGMGKERAQKAVELALEKYPVSALISTGFGGALNEKTQAGDIVVCSELVCGEKPAREATSYCILESDARLVSATVKSLKKSGMRFIIGRGITAPLVSYTPESKLALGKAFTADMVDMESYWIGEIARERNLPFIEVRAIFDSVRDDLTPLSRIMSAEGKVRPATALTRFISHPGQIKTIAQYTRNSRKATRNLADFLLQFLEDI